MVSPDDHILYVGGGDTATNRHLVDKQEVEGFQCLRTTAVDVLSTFYFSPRHCDRIKTLKFTFGTEV